MARETHGQKIFQDDQDRQRFLKMLGEVCAKTGFRIHACVVVGNHTNTLSITASWHGP
jgi:REP element-mobilizing transposase RayT